MKNSRQPTLMLCYLRRHFVRSTETAIKTDKNICCRSKPNWCRSKQNWCGQFSFPTATRTFLCPRPRLLPFYSPFEPRFDKRKKQLIQIKKPYWPPEHIRQSANLFRKPSFGLRRQSYMYRVSFCPVYLHEITASSASYQTTSDWWLSQKCP